LAQRPLDLVAFESIWVSNWRGFRAILGGEPPKSPAKRCDFSRRKCADFTLRGGQLSFERKIFPFDAGTRRTRIFGAKKDAHGPPLPFCISRSWVNGLLAELAPFPCKSTSPGVGEGPPTQVMSPFEGRILGYLAHKKQPPPRTLPYSRTVSAGVPR